MFFGYKKRLWGDLLNLKQSFANIMWCVVGDFNATRHQDERKRIHEENQAGRREMTKFNAFIEAMELGDLLLVGRKFTWYQPNGHSKSTLDRFLVSQEWWNLWSGSAQYVLGGISQIIVRSV